MALYLLGKCLESFTDTRPHPAFGDRKLESLNAAIAGSPGSAPKSVELDIECIWHFLTLCGAYHSLLAPGVINCGRKIALSALLWK